ncbi:MAG: glycosyl transferase family 1 [Thermoprotei archaeon]|nr:MAG: glycosyl transferase family 1 [Thermoprotei archaeon]
MKILQIATHYYPRVGGLEYVVKSVSERLVKTGHEVMVIAGEPDIEKPREEEINGVKVIKWPTWSPGEAYHFPRKRSELERLLKEFSKEADVVHTHSVHSVFTMYSLRTMIDMLNGSVKVVMTPYYHGTGHTFVRKFLWVFWRRHVRDMLKNCIIHTVSKLEARLVEKDFGVKAIPIENGVEEWIRDLKWKPEGYVMYSGRIEKYKNIDLLAKIIKILNRRYGFNLELKIFGRGPYRSKLERLLKNLGIPHEIGDFKPFKEYIKTLSHTTLFGLLSEKESYPQSINEANAIGVPVVIAKPWGLNFEGRKRTLLVNPRQNLDTLAENIYKFLEKASREEKSFVPTWNEVVREYIVKLYGG